MDKRAKRIQDVSLFGLLGSLLGLNQGNATTKLPNKLKIKTQGIDGSNNGFSSLAEKINFGGGFR